MVLVAADILAQNLFQLFCEKAEAARFHIARHTAEKHFRVRHHLLTIFHAQSGSQGRAGAESGVV